MKYKIVDGVKDISILRNTILVLITVGMSMISVSAKIRLPRLIGDQMVLQRDVDLKIWGWADPGEKIMLRFRGASYFAEPDADGSWSLMLPPQEAGGPFLMEINEIVIRDVLIGDVWLASGQSNMETPIQRLVDKFPDINVSNNHMIRYYKVPTQESIDEMEDIAAGERWHSGIASDIMNWTALAYFFAKENYAHTKVPVGIIVSSKGGTMIQSWVNQEELKQFPSLVHDKNTIGNKGVITQDQGVGKWFKEDVDESEWRSMEIPSLWKENNIDLKGVMWYRKHFDLPASMDRRYAKLYLGMLIDSDSVFVNGKFVGSTGYMYPPRKYDVPGGILRAGKNTITVRISSNNGDGGFVKDKPYKIVSDDFELNLGGVWKYRIGLDQSKSQQTRFSQRTNQPFASQLYNGMIYPLKDYKFRGAIWYQGESNAGDTLYSTYLRGLISGWRNLFQDADFPFLLVQLPNYLPENEKPPLKSGWATIREAQSKVAAAVPNTALTVNYDVGEWNDIHPLNKETVAQRLLLAARKLVYHEKIISAGPKFKSAEIRGDKIIISFSNSEGELRARSGELRHFAIAGEDKKFVWAEAKIKGNTVVVSSDQVKIPVAVRYAWSDNPQRANLENKEGLLAEPFRTDEW